MKTLFKAASPAWSVSVDYGFGPWAKDKGAVLVYFVFDENGVSLFSAPDQSRFYWWLSCISQDCPSDLLAFADGLPPVPADALQLGGV